MSISARDHVARHLLRDAARSYRGRPTKHTAVQATQGKIGIIGAGLAGLYAGLILQDLGYQFEIIEANPERIGGRIYTYYFSKTPSVPGYGFDYYDVGAMRFPNIPWMKRVFDLFDLLQVPQIPYYLSADNTVLYLNSQRYPATETQVGKGDIFKVSVSSGGTVPDAFLNPPYPDPTQSSSPDQYWWSAALATLRDPFKALNDVDPEHIQEAEAKAWANLVTYDTQSTRGYLLNFGYPESVVEWLETNQSATGLYDEAITETVIDSLDFDWPAGSPQRAAGFPAAHPPSARSGNADDTPPWVCIEGGSSVVTGALAKKITPNNPILLGQRAFKVSLADSTTGQLDVSYASPGGQILTRSYSQVICTVPLGCLDAIDTSSIGLGYEQNAAIRSLQYDSSCKVGIKFAKRWWEYLPKPVFGGVSSTDLPIRTVVYPSYGLKSESGPPVEGQPGILIASYTWAQDARRLGSLAKDGARLKYPKDDPLIQVTLDNLAAMHGISREDMGPVLDAYSYSWYDDINTRGAFALFGPGQFSQQAVGGQGLFAALKVPNNTGTFHIAGEATSIHHAWFLGALNSAWRAVYNVLMTLGDEQGLAKLQKNWGVPDEFEVETLDKLHGIVTGLPPLSHRNKTVS
ncbi:hypothetical protein SISSUDRAFT_1067104 [Sistotremastrum suecicum HHB10207 ss-3]|uniref:Amine oxidase domain-containing protein n=1 Tax=Sistotremastrum suecicum HHB10207 ss-3 TaxID=1314776 RepID=A0A165XI12_9AGAM|nr:hypothetical protein SISSUDRAFT_1067104 [Sistotremastrum suecicum HHB10207 ss-3]